ncbi:MAG TPA: hydantoinase B/oxoprolinase family protein [Candidatus Saccharimonadales bacterium]|nr:hydantoinase B/oxoprolinase family protein [Candidatus Saccharimonadales bacterium]
MLDAVDLALFAEWFAAVAEEMGTVLQRSSSSPNIKERRDFSCALFDARGGLLAQAAHIPVHLGAMPGAVEAVARRLRLGPGDVAILNDPYTGGTHLPDLTLVAALCHAGRPWFYLASRAHHADVGGAQPGSMGLATDIVQEGVRIPPTLLVHGGREVTGTLELLLANVRTPAERRGDLMAQRASLAVGLKRLEALARRHGPARLVEAGRALCAGTERAMRAALRAIPDGRYRAADVLDGDGCGARDVRIALALTVRGAAARLDFSGSSPQVAGPFNAPAAVVRSASVYAFRCLLPGDVPENDGLFRPIAIFAPPGTVVNPRFPAAVAAGNVETSQRITDTVLRALARALPGRVPAASAGTMNNLTAGGADPRTGAPFAYYETLGGGAGAGPGGPGASGIQVHMTNTLNTPVEALEHAYPLRVRAYALRRGSGGPGRHRGGDGLVRELEVLAACRAAIVSDRRRHGPYGLRGGAPGRPGRNRLVRGGRAYELPGKAELELVPGDVLRVESPGGGGWGRPRRRPRGVRAKRSGRA